MLTEVEWERTIEAKKATFLEADADDRAFWLESWQRTRRRMHETADAWERLRNASAEEVEDHRNNAERYTDLLEWCRNQGAPVQPCLMLEGAE